MKSNLIERIQVFGIDLGKNTFHVCAMDASGHVVLSKQFTRARLKEQLVQLPICTVALEACAGAHYWGRWRSGSVILCGSSARSSSHRTSSRTRPMHMTPRRFARRPHVQRCALWRSRRLSNSRNLQSTAPASRSCVTAPRSATRFAAYCTSLESSLPKGQRPCDATCLQSLKMPRTISPSRCVRCCMISGKSGYALTCASKRSMSRSSCLRKRTPMPSS